MLLSLFQDIPNVPEFYTSNFIECVYVNIFVLTLGYKIFPIHSGLHFLTFQFIVLQWYSPFPNGKKTRPISGRLLR